MDVGTVLPMLERHLGAAQLVAYAGATWDWHRLHYDGAYVDAAGLPGPLVDGQMFGALLAQQVLDWLGPRARVRRMGFQFAAMVFAGETVRVEGEVVEVASDGTITVAQRILAEDGKVAVREAWCEVELSNESLSG